MENDLTDIGFAAERMHEYIDNLNISEGDKEDLNLFIEAIEHNCSEIEHKLKEFGEI